MLNQFPGMKTAGEVFLHTGNDMTLLFCFRPNTTMPEIFVSSHLVSTQSFGLNLALQQYVHPCYFLYLTEQIGSRLEFCLSIESLFPTLFAFGNSVVIAGYRIAGRI